MKSVIHLRMYSHPYSGENGDEHSYYVCHDAGGLSQRLSSITFDPTISFLDLRHLLEENEVNGVMKRTRFYTEFLHFMQRCPNPLGYQDKESLTTYRIGLLRVNGSKHFEASADEITVLQQDEESSSICDVVGDLLSTDLVLIPKTQIHPHTGRLSATM